MRGEVDGQVSMFSYVDMESRIGEAHPIRAVRRIVDAALAELEPALSRMYAERGRPSIPPEHLLRALLLQVLYTVRSERLLMERLDHDLLFRWFVGLGADEPVWDHSTFSKNRDRMLGEGLDGLLFEAVRKQGEGRRLLSRDHFSVDGTLIEACASLKSFRPKDGEARGGDGSDFHGERRRNETHASTTDPESRLYRKGPGKEAKLSYMRHVLTENRNGLIVDTEVTVAGGRAEWEAGVALLSRRPGKRRRTVGADKGYDVADFVKPCREMKVTPHVAAKRSGGCVDGRTTRHAGYAVSQRKRKQVEEPFGWMKTYGLLGKLRHRGLANAAWQFRLAAAAYNIVRLRRLEAWA